MNGDSAAPARPDIAAGLNEYGIAACKAVDDTIDGCIATERADDGRPCAVRAGDPRNPANRARAAR